MKKVYLLMRDDFFENGNAGDRLDKPEYKPTTTFFFMDLWYAAEKNNSKVFPADPQILAEITGAPAEKIPHALDVLHKEHLIEYVTFPGDVKTYFTLIDIPELKTWRDEE